MPAMKPMIKTLFLILCYLLILRTTRLRLPGELSIFITMICASVNVGVPLVCNRGGMMVKYVHDG